MYNMYLFIEHPKGRLSIKANEIQPNAKNDTGAHSIAFSLDRYSPIACIQPRAVAALGGNAFALTNIEIVE